MKKILFLLFFSFNFFCMENKDLPKKIKYFRNFIGVCNKYDLHSVENKKYSNSEKKSDFEKLKISYSSGFSFGNNGLNQFVVSENINRIVNTFDKKIYKKVFLGGAGCGGLVEKIMDSRFGSTNIIYNDQSNLNYEKYSERIAKAKDILIKDIFEIQQEDFKEKNNLLVFSNSLHFNTEKSLKIILYDIYKDIDKEKLDKEKLDKNLFFEKNCLKKFIGNLPINFNLEKKSFILISSNIIFRLDKETEKDKYKNVLNYYETFEKFYNKNISNKINQDDFKKLSDDLNQEQKNTLIASCALFPCELFNKENIENIIENYEQLIIFLPNNSKEDFFKKIINFDKDSSKNDDYKKKLLLNLIENPAVTLIKDLLDRNKKICDFLNESNIDLFNIYNFENKKTNKEFGIIYLFQTR